MEEMLPSKPYECRMLDIVSDVQWNPRYNMFALSGFGQHFPVLIYVYQRSKYELDRVLLSGAGIQMGTQRGAEYEEARKNENMLGVNFDEESNYGGGGRSRKGGSRRQSMRNKSLTGGSDFDRSGRINRSFGH